MRWLKYLVILVVVLIIVAWLVGRSTPATHSATATASIAAPRDAVWQRITDVARTPAWRPSVKSVSGPVVEGGRQCWVESEPRPIHMCVERQVEPVERVVRLSSGQAFSGTWTFLVQADQPGSTRVTITEEATLPSPFLRFALLLIGMDQNEKSYLRDLSLSLTRKPPSD